MESAEDDAGSTAGASCVSARETETAERADRVEAFDDPGTSEQYRTEAHDVNTETIIKMIERLVDGPDGSENPPEKVTEPPDDVENVKLSDEESETKDQVCLGEKLSSETTVEAEINDELQSRACSSEVLSIELIPQSDTAMEPSEEIRTSSVETVASTAQEEPVFCESDLKEDINFSSMEIDSSSEVETSQEKSNFSECEPSEQTVKCVSSSDNVDTLNVEVASNEVRDDPRPDTTVSSTVDSMCSVWMSGTVTDSITKHVSSSSDTLNVENCDVIEADNLNSSSMVSICKAETSVSPKKIKLIRKRILTPAVESNSSNQNEVMGQSVSESQNRLSPVPSTSVNCISTSESISADTVEKCINRLCDEQKVESNYIVNKELNCASIEPSLGTVDMTKKNLENDIDHKKVEPLKLNLSASKVCSLSPKTSKKDDVTIEDFSKESKKEDTTVKQVPKLTIKLSNRTEECKSPIPKLTIKPMKPPPTPHKQENEIEDMHIPSVTKLNIKPIPKPAEKIGESHRKSSSSEISESECSENDDSPSTSDNAVSDTTDTDIIPKVTIKMGKPGTDSEGQFYTEKSVPKLTIKNLQKEELESEESISKVRLKICHNDDKHCDKIQKITIKTTVKSEDDSMNQCHEEVNEKPNDLVETEQENINQALSKYKTNLEVLKSDTEEVPHVPKLTIVLKTDESSKNLRKGSKSELIDSPHIVTKLNIKPIPLPEDFSQTEEQLSPVKEKVQPIVNQAKPKHKEDQVESFKNDIPVVTKLHIKPILNSDEESYSIKEKVSDWDNEQDVPMVSKLNIKPVVEPLENESKSETENSSDENSDVPVVTKINIKPIIKPSEMEEIVKVNSPNTITKLNIKPIIKSDNEAEEPLTIRGNSPNTITKLNIKPILKPDNEVEDIAKTRVNSPSLITKLNIKPIVKPENENQDSMPTKIHSPNTITKLNIKPIVKPDYVIEEQATAKVKSPNTITKLNIKPVIKPQNEEETTGIVNPITKLNIKPIIKPANEEQETTPLRTSSPITKLNIKPIPKPEVDMNSPVKGISPTQITKLNIKPLVKPDCVDIIANSSNTITKLNIKPIVKPDNDLMENTISKSNSLSKEENITDVRLNSPNSKAKSKPITACEIADTMAIESQNTIPKINIKPVVINDSEKDNRITENITNPNTQLNIMKIDEPVMKLEYNTQTKINSPNSNTKLNIKPITKPDISMDHSLLDTSTVRSDSLSPIMNLNENSLDIVILAGQTKETAAKIEPLLSTVAKQNTKHFIPGDRNEENAKVKDGSELLTNLHINDIDNIVTEISNTRSAKLHSPNTIKKLNIKPILKPESKSEESPAIIDSTKSITNISAHSSTEVENIENETNAKKIIINSIPKPSKMINSSEDKNVSISNLSKLNVKPITQVDTNVIQSSHLVSNNYDEERHVKNPPIIMKINLKDTPEEKVLKLAEKSDLLVPNILKDSEVQMFSKEDPKEKILDSKLSDVEITHYGQYDNTNLPLKSETLVNKGCDVLCSPTETEEYSTRIELNSKKTSDSNKITLKETSEIGCSTKSISEYSGKNVININEKHKISSDKNTGTEKCTLLKRLLSQKKSSDIIESKHIEPVSDDLKSPASTVTSVMTKETDNVINELDNLKKPKNDISFHENICKNDSNEHCLESALISKGVPDNYNKTDIGNKNIVHESSVIDDKLFKPLEIITSEKSLATETSGQDSPRIILKINKTDHGTSSTIISEDVINLDSPQNCLENDTVHNAIDDKTKLTRPKPNRRKQTFEQSPNQTVGKRLRSSKVVEEVSPVKKDINRQTDTSKDTDVNILDAKRIKLDGLLTNSVSITKVTNTSNKNTNEKNINHSIMSNDNGSKNGSSKLLDILTNLKVLPTPYDEAAVITKNTNITYAESLTSSNSSDVVEVMQPMQSESDIMSNDNSNAPIDITCDETIQDPLDMEIAKSEEPKSASVPQELMTPTPRKRGRPRKLPVSEDKQVVLPVPAIEERPQRSLRLYRERPAILSKPRGRRGRGGRGRRRSSAEGQTEPEDSGESPSKIFDKDDEEEIDPTSSRIKLPRLTEALDNMPLVCGSRVSTESREVRRLLSDNASLKVVLEELRVKSPECIDSSRGRGGRPLRGRGSRGGAMAKTPRSQRGRRGGGRGAMYMKETMGIYGRVCGPATTTVELFEEETCMMDDNATPSKPAHLLDEDSQSSVKSGTNESYKFKKSKFADLLDSNKVWTAADVKEYKWPVTGTSDNPSRVMMIQEQVAMFLEVKGFKRKYPELKRRTICGEERDFVLAKGLVTEALCDLGITAVDAGDVLDIMLSDFPHKYEEFRTHQHQRLRQLSDPEPVAIPVVEDVKVEEIVKPEKPEGKPDAKSADKTEPMSEKMRQELAAAAIASASEFNSRLNASRRPACVDLQSYVVHGRRPPATPAPRPPPNLYPHALLPGQYQHWYRVPTDSCFSYYPLNTVLSAAPPPPDPETHSDSEPDWGYLSSDCDSDGDRNIGGKRKKVSKSKKAAETSKATASPAPPEDTCRLCGLEDRRLAYERFLTCAKCHDKLHPACLEFGLETTRKCRTYPWHCPTCKVCVSCARHADGHKMVYCDLCDRGRHTYCAGMDAAPQGRWHCVECAVCKSCGARTPEGLTPSTPATTPFTPGSTPTNTPSTPLEPAEWQHQSRRGPGGQKQYSHTLCVPCARAFRIGRYCPVCERSFIGPKGTMQLVICKLCDRQHHQECVSRGSSTPNVMEYTCSECRRTGITSRSAAARLAPRTIATLFMAKRRFNKYVHRQYVASRLQEQQAKRDQEDCT